MQLYSVDIGTMMPIVKIPTATPQSGTYVKVWERPLGQLFATICVGAAMMWALVVVMD